MDETGLQRAHEEDVGWHMSESTRAEEVCNDLVCREPAGLRGQWQSQNALCASNRRTAGKPCRCADRALSYDGGMERLAAMSGALPGPLRHRPTGLPGRTLQLAGLEAASERDRSRALSARTFLPRREASPCEETRKHGHPPSMPVSAFEGRRNRVFHDKFGYGRGRRRRGRQAQPSNSTRRDRRRSFAKFIRPARRSATWPSEAGLKRLWRMPGEAVDELRRRRKGLSPKTKNCPLAPAQGAAGAASAPKQRM